MRKVVVSLKERKVTEIDIAPEERAKIESEWAANTPQPKPPTFEQRLKAVEAALVKKAVVSRKELEDEL